MPLPSGTRFGPYEIVSALGAGGMGEVYRARDSRLKRDVAIKVLLPEVAGDADRLARFQREAEALASLNHTNIAAIYAVEGSALVLELVDGPTLADRLADGAMTVEEALPVVRQLIDALEYAHEKGIVHRDLKPANVKVTADGNVKVLDFGLAKALANEPATGDPKSSPTLTMRATMAGTILGSAAYMAPEQARGQNVDKRADIWAFGALVYELLTARALFDAPTVSDTLALVLTKDADLGAAPARFRPLLRKCLERDVRKRLRDIGDARILLEETPAALPAPVRRSWLPPALGGLAAASTLAAVGLAWLHFREEAPEPEPVRFEIAMPEKASLQSGIAVSPDGRRIAFIAARGVGAPRTIWVRQLDSLQSQSLAGTDWAGPFLTWSPDGRRLMFNDLSGLHAIDAAGGTPRMICDECGDWASSGAWSRDGAVLVSTNGGLVRAPANGGHATPVVRFQVGRGDVYFLRDGSHFLYSHGVIGDEQIYLGSLNAPATAEGTPLTSVNRGRFLYTEGEREGYVLSQQNGALVAQRFDVHKLQLKGEPIPVADHVVSYGASAGVLAYRSGESLFVATRLLWFSRDGKQAGQLGEAGTFVNVQLGPGAKTVLVDRRESGGAYRVWLGDVGRGVFSRLSATKAIEVCPAVAPDGRVAFTYSESGTAKDIYIKSANGAAEPELLVGGPNVKHPNHFSPDGRFLIYDEHNGAQEQDLWIVPMSGDHKPIPFLTTGADESHGQFSPDSKWIAYASNESGRQEVYVRAFAPDRVPAAGPGKWLVSTGGGDKPRWRHDGKELFYLSPQGKMMAVAVKAGAEFEPSLPVPLFDARAEGFLPYDVSPDGRFLINTPVESRDQASGSITVVLNWTAALKR